MGSGLFVLQPHDSQPVFFSILYAWNLHVLDQLILDVKNDRLSHRGSCGRLEAFYLTNAKPENAIFVVRHYLCIIDDPRRPDSG